MWTVYKHTAPNGKVYIGITKKKPERRWDNGNAYKNNEHFYRAILNYKWENIKHEIVENGLTKEQACDLEIELIAYYDSTNPDKGYNHSTGGECGSLGVHPSDETRKKLSESHKRAYINNPEIRMKLSKAHKGRQSPRKGAHLSAEARRKLSEAKKGIHPSPETRKKLSEAHKGANNSFYGKHHSDETKRKISESKKRTYLDPELRRKLSEAHKGNSSRAKAIICVETGILYTSGVEAAESIGVTQQAISNAVHGKQKTAGGYHWKYIEEQS